jgi:hypothetical protein
MNNHMISTVRKIKRLVNLQIIGTSLLSGEVRLKGIPRIILNDWCDLELSGSG